MLLPSTVITNRWLAFLLAAALLFVLWNFSPARTWVALPSHRSLLPGWAGESSPKPSTLPPDYAPSHPVSSDCDRRYGTLFLETASNTSVQYCSPDSASRLICLRSHLGDKIDSTCLGTPARFDGDSQKFDLDCKLRPLTDSERELGVPDVASFPSYWYETGTKLILDRHVNLEAGHDAVAGKGLPRKFTILVRREQPVDNLWHHFMQLGAVFFTLDLFQMATDPGTGRPMYQPEDIANTQVMVFDGHADGPFYDQWKAFAGRGVVRANDPSAAESSVDPETIIVPLPGSANPLWSGDWGPDTCENSQLLHVFAKRMANFYGVKDEVQPPDRPLVLTFISRNEKRSLVNKEQYIDGLKNLYPEVQINLVDFASLTFAEQIATVRKTDILAGIHGAGLGHGMFLPPNSALAEIMPVDFNHKGFRNMAKRIGHKYFTTHAIKHENYTTSKGWQYDNVFIEQDRFNGLIGAAIKSMYHRGLLNKDIN